MDQGVLVVDPFRWFGITGVGGKQLNIRFIACDVDRKAVEVATARVQIINIGKSEKGVGEAPYS